LSHTSQVTNISANENIKSKRVLLIDENGNRMGEFLTQDAINIAREKGLDLIEVSNSNNQTVCKIADLGKMKYLMKKKESLSRKNQVQQQVKEIKVRPLTSDHDLKIKVQNIRKFISQGNKVKVSVTFYGREMSHSKIGYGQCDKIKEMVEDIAIMEQSPSFDGRTIHMVLSPCAKGNS